MEPCALFQSRLIHRPPEKPVLTAMAEKIVLAQILDPDEAFLGIMIIDFGGANIVRFQKSRDLDVMTVLFPFEVVLHQDELLLRGVVNPVKLSPRSASLDRRDLYRVDIKSRKMDPGLMEKAFGFHLK